METGWTGHVPGHEPLLSCPTPCPNGGNHLPTGPVSLGTSLFRPVPVGDVGRLRKGTVFSDESVYLLETSYKGTGDFTICSSSGPVILL